MSMLQIFSTQDTRQIIQVMKGLNVSPEGLSIMAPKGVYWLALARRLPLAACTILKQEMLSLGAEAAISRQAIYDQGGRNGQGDVLLMGTVRDFGRLCQKLKAQPFGLCALAEELTMSLSSRMKNNYVWRFKGGALRLGRRVAIMGILNLTYDSFSKDGLLKKGEDERSLLKKVLTKTEEMVSSGVDIIDVGGESTRPGSRPVSVKEELRRTVPVIRMLSRRFKVPLSIDTYKSEVAQQALQAGASIVNDISGLRFDKGMASVIARYKAGCVLMHIKGRPRTMQRNPVYRHLTEEILLYLDRAIRTAHAAGIERDCIVIDPGIGFGKTTVHNLSIIRNLAQLKVLDRPILVGLSRKSFIGKVLNLPVEQRQVGTMVASALAVAMGAHILRVHDVEEIGQVARITEAVLTQELT